MSGQTLRLWAIVSSFFGLLLIVIAAIIFAASSTRAAAPITRIASVNAPAARPVATGAWTDIAPFPTVSISPTPGTYPLKLKRAGAAAYPPNGKVYLMGGRHGVDGEDMTLQWIWEYTPGEPDSWVRKNGMLDELQVGNRYTANMAVAVLTDTTGPKIYAIGGSSINSEPTPVVRVYDPDADAVTVLASDPWPANPVRIPGGYAVYNNKLYIFGGFSSWAGSVFADTWVFDPMGAAGQRWTRLLSADLNLGRGYIAGATLDGKIYAVGGDVWQGSPQTLVPVGNVEMLDPSKANPTWTPVASLPTARGDMGAWAYNTGTGYEISGHILVAGGVYPVPDANAYLYDPASDSWSQTADLAHATRNYGVAQLDGYLYALGGYDYSGGIPNGANFSQRYDANIPTSPSPTRTGTPLTLTPTRTPTFTPTITSTPCGTGYVYTTAPGTIVPGDTDIGNHCGDCITHVILPFPFTLYDTSYGDAYVSSDGNVQFNSTNVSGATQCLPRSSFGATIFAYWTSLLTSGTGCTGGTGACGIYTSVSGSAPNRVLNIEWRARYFNFGILYYVQFEVRLYEGQGGPGRFDIVMGQISPSTTHHPTIGVQDPNASRVRQVGCLIGPPVGTMYSFAYPACPVASPTLTATATAVSTDTPTSPPDTATPTDTATYTNTPVAVTDTPTPERLLVGHVTWQGRPAQPDGLQALPISLTLKMGDTEVNYPVQQTDASGSFTVSVGGLAGGEWSWRVKGPKYLANSGTTNFGFWILDFGTSGNPKSKIQNPKLVVEMGLMRAGDANDDNLVNTTDFTVVKASYGKGVGDPGYDDRADFNGDNLVNVFDFILLKVNFGQGGAPPIGPGVGIRDQGSGIRGLGVMGVVCASHLGVG